MDWNYWPRTYYAVHMIKGAIFDMDGVLVDNLEHHIRAWQRLGKELSLNLARDDIRRLFGRRNDEILRELIDPALAPDQIVRLGEHKEQLYREIVAPEIQPVRGLFDLLDGLQKSGVRLAVASSACLQNVDLVLDCLKIRHYFDTVVIGADVTRSKPDPEIFLLAARRLGLTADQCVVFEDSASGITAACQAGCACVVLTTTHSEDELRHLPAARFVRDFAGITASNLEELLRK